MPNTRAVLFFSRNSISLETWDFYLLMLHMMRNLLIKKPLLEEKFVGEEQALIKALEERFCQGIKMHPLPNKDRI